MQQTTRLTWAAIKASLHGGVRLPSSQVTTGLQINVDCCAPRETPSLFESQYLCVFDAFIAVKALAHYDAIAHDNRSY